MSIAERILGLIAAVLLMPLFAAGLLLIVLVGGIQRTLVESYGLPEAPVNAIVILLNVGILIGTLALAFIIMLRVRRWLAVRWSPFRVEGETSTTVGRPSRDRSDDPATSMARVRRFDSRLKQKPKQRARRGSGR